MFCSKTALSLGAAAVALTASLLTAAALRPVQDAGDGMPGMDPDMMKKMMELATPGAEHEGLAAQAGSWTQSYKMKWSPDMAEMTTQGTCEAKAILGGRYLLQTIRFDMMGMPMEGFQIQGYDKMTGEYISLWADSMSTWWVTSRGKTGPDGTIEMKGTMIDVAGERPFRSVTNRKSADEYEFEMYDTIPPHGEVKVMTVTSKRKKG